MLILDAFEQGSPYSWVMLVAALAGLAAAVVSTVQAFRHPLRRPTAVAFALPLLALAVFVVAAVVGVHQARALMIAVTFSAMSDPSQRATDLARGVSLQMNLIPMLTILGLPLAGLIGFGAVMPVVAASRHGKSPPLPPLLLGFAVGAPLIVLSLGVQQYALHVIHAFASIAGVEPSLKTTLLARSLDEASGLLVAARVQLLVVGALGLIAAVIGAVWAARRGQVASPSTLGVAAALLAVGALAYVTTRGHAAERLLPVLDNGWDVTAVDHPPSFGHCSGPVEWAELLMVKRDVAELDGKAVTLDECLDWLVTIKNNFRLLHPSDEFAGKLVVLAGVDTPMARVAPYLETARDAGYEHVSLLAVNRRPTHTHTIGDLERFEECARPFDVVFEGGTPATAYRTWGDFAAALERGEAAQLRAR